MPQGTSTRYCRKTQRKKGAVPWEGRNSRGQDTQKVEWEGWGSFQFLSF